MPVVSVSDQPESVGRVGSSLVQLSVRQLALSQKHSGETHVTQ